MFAVHGSVTIIKKKRNQPGVLKRIPHSEEIRHYRSANHLGNVARHVPRRMARDLTPEFLLASNRHTVILKKVPRKWFGTVYIVFR